MPQLRALLLLVLASLPCGARAETVDRVVVVVEERLVFASQVRLEEQLAHMDASPTWFWSADRADAVTRLTQSAVLRRRAAGLELYDAPVDQIDQRLELLRARFPNRVAWQNWLRGVGSTEDELRLDLGRRIVVERFLRRNLPQDDLPRPSWERELEAAMANWQAGVAIRVVQPVALP